MTGADGSSAERTRPGRRRGDLARLVLAAVWAVLLLSAVLLREDDRSLAELYDAVGSGDVERVVVVGGLPDVEGVGGSAQVDVRWGPLGDRHVTRLLQVAGPGSASTSDGREITTDDVVAQLRARDGGLEVEQRPYGSGVTGTLLGARLAGPAVAVLLLAVVATLLLLVRGPEPQRATRWAWFWLLPVPFGALAFCLLSGPTPGVPQPRSDRRLTGGWAFLLGAVLGGVGGVGSTWAR